VLLDGRKASYVGTTVAIEKRVRDHELGRMSHLGPRTRKARLAYVSRGYESRDAAEIMERELAQKLRRRGKRVLGGR